MNNVDAEKKFNRLRLLRVMLPCALLYIMAYMDRSNISFAIAGGMAKSLSLTDSVAGLAAGIFFIGYLFLQVPGGHLAERGLAKNFITYATIAWGILAILCAYAQNAGQMLTLRFLLGVAEGGMFPAILVLISHWYTDEERGRANAIFIISLAIASIITAPLSGWIISHWGWRVVFTVEGIIPLVLLFVSVPLLTERPEDAAWLPPERKELMRKQSEQEQAAVKRSASDTFSYGKALSNANTWLVTVGWFLYQIGFYGFTLWMPSIMKVLTKTGIGYVGLLAMVPWILAIPGLLYFANLSDRSLQRKRYIVITITGFTVCLIISIFTVHMVWVSYAFLTLSGLFFLSPQPIFWAYVPMVFPKEVAGGVRGFVNAFGQLGGFVGPYLVGLLSTQFHSLYGGVCGLVICLVIGIIVLSTVRQQASTAASGGTA